MKQDTRPAMDILEIDTTMLPSQNLQHGWDTRGARPRKYTKKEFSVPQKKMLEDVQYQVMAARWQPLETDRYMIVATLPFLLRPGETPSHMKGWRDADNPWKPMQDVLKAGGALYEDSKVEQPFLQRRWVDDVRKMLAHIVIARVHQEEMEPFPILDFFDQWAQSRYTISRRNPLAGR